MNSRVLGVRFSEPPNSFQSSSVKALPDGVYGMSAHREVFYLSLVKVSVGRLHGPSHNKRQ